MAGKDPVAEIDPRFSSEAATATPWAGASKQLDEAEIFWLTTVRPDGRPHVTPLLAIWLDDVLYFSTGEGERKALNLAQNAHCILTTGCNTLTVDGLDLVVEGDAMPVHDAALLQHLADRYAAKYNWHYTVRHGALLGDQGNLAQVYAVAPTAVFGFGKGTTFSQTRWRF